jgi:hypothetical protein
VALLFTVVAGASSNACWSSPFSDADLAKAEESAGTSLELSPRSPRQTMQVPDMGRSEQEFYVSKEKLGGHGGKFMGELMVRGCEEEQRRKCAARSFKGTAALSKNRPSKAPMTCSCIAKQAP